MQTTLCNSNRELAFEVPAYIQGCIASAPEHGLPGNSISCIYMYMYTTYVLLVYSTGPLPIATAALGDSDFY